MEKFRIQISYSFHHRLVARQGARLCYGFPYRNRRVGLNLSLEGLALTVLLTQIRGDSSQLTAETNDRREEAAESIIYI